MFTFDKKRDRLGERRKKTIMTNKVSISKTFDWYLTEIMPIVEKYAVQSKKGYHGLYTHTAAVVFRGIDYALSLGEKTDAIVLACAFHDMARIHDGNDTIHGPNAIPLAHQAMDQIGNIGYDTRESIIYAIKNHSLNLKAPDYISACLWDADRTRLAWECGYQQKFFTTRRAQKIASGSATDYLEFMKKNISTHARQIIELGESY